MKLVDIPTSPNRFEPVQIHDIEVQNGLIAVGFYIEGGPGSWTNYDNVALVTASPATGPSMSKR